MVFRASTSDSTLSNALDGRMHTRTIYWPENCRMSLLWCSLLFRFNVLHYSHHPQCTILTISPGGLDQRFHRCWSWPHGVELGEGYCGSIVHLFLSLQVPFNIHPDTSYFTLMLYCPVPVRFYTMSLAICVVQWYVLVLEPASVRFVFSTIHLR